MMRDLYFIMDNEGEVQGADDGYESKDEAASEAMEYAEEIAHDDEEAVTLFVVKAVPVVRVDAKPSKVTAVSISAKAVR